MALIAALAIFFCQVPLADEPPAIAPFSTMDPAVGISASWRPLTFPRISTQTDYRLLLIDGRKAVEAHSQGGASGLIHALDADPLQFPWLSWQWRVDHVLEGSDVTTKAGDDCAARVYVAFRFDERNKSWWERFKHGTKRFFAGHEIPGSAIVYVWANGVEVGSIVASPYTKHLKLIAVQSGNKMTKQWLSQRRNIVQDYRLAFGTATPEIMGIAIMTDTDNTGTEATAYYGDIQLHREAP